jgi:hypothetical protein
VIVVKMSRRAAALVANGKERVWNACPLIKIAGNAFHTVR